VCGVLIERGGSDEADGNSSYVKREMSSSNGMTVTKLQFAVETSVIVQNPFIDDFAEFGARDTAGRRAG
jgi:hypothetical protein